MKQSFVNVIFFLVLCAPLIQSNMGPQGFKAFLNHYFVETGTLGGESIVKALKTGFKKVLSIEYDYRLFVAASKRFDNNKNVRIVYGDSSKDLWDMIKDIDQEITFWLDAHIFPPRTDGGKNCPLMEELDQIKRHHIKMHTILIDDMHCAGTESFDFITKDDLIKKIKTINPNYVITYVDGGDEGEYKDNVMVAQVVKNIGFSLSN